jgi:hypothetical protein
MKKTNLLAILTLAATPTFLHAQTTTYSDVVGYNTSSFPAGTSGHGVGFVKAALFTGSASKLSSTSFSVAGLTVANNVLAPVSGLPTHYIEVVAGVNEGLSADIVSNTGATVVVDGDLSSLGATEQITIRAHVKASEVFAGNTSLTELLDTLLVYNADGSSYTLLRDSTSPSGWIDPNSFTPADVVIYPGQAFLLGTSAEGSFTTTGNVKSTATLIPLYASSLNYISAGNPSTSPDIQTSGLGGNLAVLIDTVSTFVNNGSFEQSATYLWAGHPNNFIDPNLFSTVSGVGLPGTGAVLVSVSADTVWKAPAPYTP